MKRIWAGLVAAVLMSVLSFGSIYAIAADSRTGGYESLDGKNWMSAIADDRYIYEINLPGTHDSTTAYCKNATDNSVKLFGIPIFNAGKYAQTQSLTLTRQLEAGVRYFDLRFSPKLGQLLLCHGNNGKVAFVNKAIKILSYLNPIQFLLDRLNLPFLSLDTEFYAYEDEACTVPITCDRVFLQVKDFLKEHPSEAVIITAKKRKR